MTPDFYSDINATFVLVVAGATLFAVGFALGYAVRAALSRGDSA